LPTAKPNGDGFRRYLYQNVENIGGYIIGYEEPTENGVLGDFLEITLQ